jgi:uncharacterized Zn finger protein
MKDTAVEVEVEPRKRENAQTKGRRLLVEGRLVVRAIRGDGTIIATCRGDSGEAYTLGYDATKKQWRCTCVEMKGRCSHLIALQLVTIVKPPKPGGSS